MAHEIDRLLATPTMRPCLPERSGMRIGDVSRGRRRTYFEGFRPGPLRLARRDEDPWGPCPWGGRPPCGRDMPPRVWPPPPMFAFDRLPQNCWPPCWCRGRNRLGGSPPG